MRTNNISVDIDKIPIRQEVKEEMKKIDRYKKASCKDYSSNKSIHAENRIRRSANASARLFNATVDAIVKHNKTAKPYEVKAVPTKRPILPPLVPTHTLTPEERANFSAYKKTNSMTFSRSEADWYRQIVSNVPKDMQWTIGNIVWWDYVSMIPRHKVNGLFDRYVYAKIPDHEPTVQQIVDCLIAIGYPVDFAVRRVMVEDFRNKLPERSCPHKYSKYTNGRSDPMMRNMLNELLQGMKHLS